MQDATDTFDRTYQATPDSVARVRADVTAFATAHGVGRRHVDDIRLAVSEAVTNAVRHGYRGSPGTIHVTTEYADGGLRISIRDFGCGMRPRPVGTRDGGMGLGLALIGRLVSGLSVAPHPGAGTDVRMRFDLARAATPSRQPLTLV